MARLWVDNRRPVQVVKLPEDSVIVMDEEARHGGRCGLSDLLLDPIERGRICDIEMDNFPSANLHEYKDIIHLEENGMLD
jgi:hypothetical protein